MQKWQYKTINRVRTKLPTKAMDVAQWQDPLGGFDKILNGLGDQGWELVAVIPQSNHIGDHWAGFTSSESYVFKKPVE